MSITNSDIKSAFQQIAQNARLTLDRQPGQERRCLEEVEVFAKMWDANLLDTEDEESESPSLAAKLEQMAKLFEKLDAIYSTIPNEEQEKILDFHNETSSLPHCIRWGNQAAGELTEKYPT